MLSWFKSDPLKALKKDYARLTEEAMQAQRRGDIEGYSELMSQANQVYEKIQKLEN